MRHRHDAVGVHLATLVDRDIFARHKALVREVISDLVRRVGVAERPAAAPMNEMTVLVILARPQSRDPARFAVLALELGVDSVVGIEWRNDDIGVAGVAFGVTGLACKLDTDLPKLRRKGWYSGSAWMDALHVGIVPLRRTWPSAAAAMILLCRDGANVGAPPASSGS